MTDKPTNKWEGEFEGELVNEFIKLLNVYNDKKVVGHFEHKGEEIRAMLDFIHTRIAKGRQEERERIVRGLEKEYEGQISQVQDAIEFIKKLKDL